jgi:hypothetical protein
MISAQTPLAFVARENRFTLFRVMLHGESACRSPAGGFLPSDIFKSAKDDCDDEKS